MKIKHALVSLSVALMLAPAAVSAQGVNDKAVDKQGHPVMDARGNCVMTKWQVRDDVCGKLRLSKEERTVYFDFNKSTIKASEKAKLDSLTKNVTASKQVASVDIVGFADMIGTNSYNKALSMRRAEAVKAYLMKRGVKTRKVDMRAMGEEASVTHCDSKMAHSELVACLAADRRVEIELNFAQ